MKLEPIGEREAERTIQAKTESEMHLLDLLLVLVTQRRFIALATLAVAVATTVVVLVIPSWYTAETMLLPPTQTSAATALLGQLAGGSTATAGALASVAGATLGIKNPSDMYVSLLRSRTVEDAMIQRFGLMAKYHKKTMVDTRKKFERHTSVVLGTKDGLIRITVEARDPKLAAEMANAYVEELRKVSARLAITEASQRRLFFQQQLQEARDNLTVAEEAMKSTQQSTGVLQIDSQARSLIEAAAMLRGQVVAKEVQIESMRSFAAEDNPELILAKQQLAALKAQLSKLAGPEQDAKNDFVVPKGKVPEAGMEYLRKLRDLKYHETIFELIAKQFEIAKLDEARQGAVIQVADVAVPPDKRSFPMRTLTIVLMTMLAFIAVCGWCICGEAIRRMRRNPVERERLEALAAALRSKP